MGVTREPRALYHQKRVPGPLRAGAWFTVASTSGDSEDMLSDTPQDDGPSGTTDFDRYTPMHE